MNLPEFHDFIDSSPFLVNRICLNQLDLQLKFKNSIGFNYQSFLYAFKSFHLSAAMFIILCVTDGGALGEEEEQRILQELLEVVEQRDALVKLLEEDRLKYDHNSVALYHNDTKVLMHKTVRITLFWFMLFPLSF